MIRIVRFLDENSSYMHLRNISLGSDNQFLKLNNKLSIYTIILFCIASLEKIRILNIFNLKNTLKCREKRTRFQT